MKRILLILFCLLFLTGCSKKETVIQGFSMDASYQIEAKNISKEQQIAIKAYLGQVDSVFNAYQKNSLIGKLNQTKVLTVSDSEEAILFDLIQRTLPFCNEYFDISIRPVSKLWNFKADVPTVPAANELQNNLNAVGYHNIELTGNTVLLKNGAELEGGAVVKGYVCDRVAELLSDKIALIDIGGTVKTIGQKITAGVKSPDRNGLLCSFILPDGKAVATSGSYERNFVIGDTFYHHILSPQTGYPVESNFVSVTVISDSALQADILSTTLFAENSLRVPKSAEVIYVTKDGSVYKSPKIEQFTLFNNTYQVTTLEKE